MTQRVEKKAVLVGAPNVGKSVLFNNFTGVYVTVSNYPGTTVDISRGMGRFDGNTWEIIDTPGLYSLIPITEEEQVTRRLLISERPDVVIHVIDAKNIRRMLNMTLQLLEAGLPVILDLNIMDEAERDGVYIKRSLLAEKLGIPVIATSAVYQLGLKELKIAVSRYQYRQPLLPKFSRAIEEALERIAGMLMQDYGMNKRMAALLMLQNDPEMQKKLQEEPRFASIREIICDLASRYPDGLEYALAAERQAQVDEILAGIVRYGPNRQMRLADRIDNYVRQPLTGLPLLCLVLYLGLYQFVGRFGAGFLVDCLDKRLFADLINPMVERAVFAYLPEEWMRSLILGDYGLFTLGVRYAVVIILPIVGTFFLAFALLEDCGYLPRL
ncbi:FeoB small GTPase domain-containing protein, partial [Thermosinus carboxydivorans]|uniref:FeoB small GTPase domain-containing protein n=1 Tax=Thermosinus carboxydivorans TaxID=261685 RepID=UPI000592D804